MNILKRYEEGQLKKLTEKKSVADFKPGDTVKVNVRIVEGANERIQAFEGVCIAKKNAGLNSAFTVRKISHGEGVERVFPTYSPAVESVEVVRTGNVSRAKLYYMRGLTGKAARIEEKRDLLLGMLGADSSGTAVAADADVAELSGENVAAEANAEAKAEKPAKADKKEKAAKKPAKDKK